MQRIVKVLALVSVLLTCAGLFAQMNTKKIPQGNAYGGNPDWVYYGSASQARLAGHIGIKLESTCPEGYPTCLNAGGYFTFAGIWSWRLYQQPFSNLTELSTDYYIATAGAGVNYCIGGSPRFTIFIDADHDGSLGTQDFTIYAYIPEPCGTTGSWLNTGNVVDSSTMSFDLSGPSVFLYNTTWDQIVSTLPTGALIYGIAFDVDSGWKLADGGIQTVYIDNLDVNGFKFNNLNKAMTFDAN